MRMMAVIATFEGLPAAFMRSYCALRSGLYRVATMAGSQSAPRKGFPPPWMRDCPRHLPDCLGLEQCRPVTRLPFLYSCPISGVSIRIVEAAAAPMPFMLRNNHLDTYRKQYGDDDPHAGDRLGKMLHSSSRGRVGGGGSVQPGHFTDARIPPLAANRQPWSIGREARSCNPISRSRE